MNHRDAQIEFVASRSLIWSPAAMLEATAHGKFDFCVGFNAKGPPRETKYLPMIVDSKRGHWLSRLKCSIFSLKSCGRSMINSIYASSSYDLKVAFVFDGSIWF